MLLLEQIFGAAGGDPGYKDPIFASQEVSGVSKVDHLTIWTIRGNTPIPLGPHVIHLVTTIGQFRDHHGTTLSNNSRKGESFRELDTEQPFKENKLATSR